MTEFYAQALKFWTSSSAHVDARKKFSSQELEVQKRLMNIFQVGDMYYFIFNICDVAFDFMSPEIKTVVGLEPNLSMYDFMERIHPEDRSYFMEFETYFRDFLLNLPPEKMGKYKCRYDFRIKNAEGKYIRLLHQLLVIEFDDSSVPQRSLGVHTDITHLKEHGKPMLSLIGLDGEPSYVNITIAQPQKKSGVLSRRESEVLLLLASGQTSATIADALNIARHTVDSHRKNLLRKTGCANTSELVSKSIVEGWI